MGEEGKGFVPVRNLWVYLIIAPGISGMRLVTREGEPDVPVAFMSRNSAQEWVAERKLAGAVVLAAKVGLPLVRG